MNKIFKYLLLIILLSSIIIYPKCGKDKIEERIYVVKIDSLKYNSPINFNDTLDLLIYFTIGPSVYHSYLHIDTLLNENRIEITVYGKEIINDSGISADQESPWTKEIKLWDFEIGEFLVKINLPNNNYQVDTVIVK